MSRSPLILPLILLLAFSCAVFAHGAAEKQPAPVVSEFPWVAPFEDGRYIGEILPEGINATDFESASKVLYDENITAIILDAGGSGFDSVVIGLYDEKKREISPLWTSSQRDGLPHVIESLSFSDIFIQYGYLPGDKYVSCNFKLAVGGKSNLKIFQVERDMDYAGVSLKNGDFILAGDSGGDGTLSNMSNGDYSDLVFVLRPNQSAPTPITQAILAVGGCGLAGLTIWSVRRGKKGLEQR